MKGAETASARVVRAGADYGGKGNTVGKPDRIGLWIVAVIVASFLCGTIAEARPNEYQSQGTGSTPENWNDWHSWEILDGGFYRDMTSSDPLPTAGDTVVIRTPDVIEVTDSRSVTSLTINAGGRLDIKGGADQDPPSVGRLTLSATGTPSLVINPEDGLRLLSACSELRFEASVIVVGEFGSIHGLDSDAVIALAPGGGEITLTSAVPIHGALVIKVEGSGEGNFCNSAGVFADRSGHSITLHSSLADISDDGNSGCALFWSVQEQSAVLRFDRATTALSGGFRVGPGRLDINKLVSTSGGLLFKTGGSITPNVLTLGTFWFDGHCGSDCPSVLSPVIWPVRCH